MSDPLVSVVIPAFNAGKTLDETLRSARDQTYRALDIIVVDDGSHDQTYERARAHAAADERVRVFRQAHQGQSAARNRGIAVARADLIAPLDADDLWRPSKIARQVATLHASGPRVGLVYTWFALLDEEGRIRSTGHCPTDSGAVLRSCCRRNLVGNGSGALMRKDAVLQCGGYDETLTACEDLKLYAAIAERFDFAVVPDHLTGYRQSNHNVSSRIEEMLRGADIVIGELERKHPPYRPELVEMRRGLYRWLFARAVIAGQGRASLQLLRRLWLLERSQAVLAALAAPKVLSMQSWYRWGRPLARAVSRQHRGFTVPRFLTGESVLPLATHK